MPRKLFVLGYDQIERILSAKLWPCRIEFDHDDDIVADSGEGTVILVDGVNENGDEYEDLIDNFKYQEIIRQYITNLGWSIFGMRFFSLSEGLGIVAIVSRSSVP